MRLAAQTIKAISAPKPVSGGDFVKICLAGFKAGAHLDTGIPMLLLGRRQWTT